MWVNEWLSRKFYLKSESLTDSLKLSLAKPLTHRKNKKIQTNWLTCREAENNFHNGETLCLHTHFICFCTSLAGNSTELYVTISRQCLICCLHSVVSSQCIGAELAGVYKPEVDHEWELICRSWDSTWSSGQQMKMENCYHLLGPFKYVQPGKVVRSWWMPHMPAVVDMIKKYIWGPTPLPPPPCSTILRYNRQTDVCRSPASTENCLCAKLPSGWGILFIRWTSPIMFLSPSVLLEFFV